MVESARAKAVEQLIDRAKKRGVTIGTAESCTGGLICSALTDVPGSSAVVRGGVVSYAVAIKESVLGVSPSITNDPKVGVVSAECAQAMCVGARRVLGCDLAVSTTGIAGPGGAEPGKPVGTVWFGVASERGVRSRLKTFAGDRSCVREQAVAEALSLLLEELDSLI